MVSENLQVSRRLDPRYFQIAFLLSLLAFGVLVRDFSVSLPSILAVVLTGAFVQGVAVLVFKVPANSFLSAAISGISMLLLCRAQSPWLLALGMVLAIGSKFVLRFRGKHFFN